MISARSCAIRLSSLAVLTLPLMAGMCAHTKGLGCGALFKYSNQEIAQVENEVAVLEANGQAEKVRAWLNDYGQTRDSIRACLAERKRLGHK